MFRLSKLLMVIFLNCNLQAMIASSKVCKFGDEDCSCLHYFMQQVSMTCVQYSNPTKSKHFPSLEASLNKSNVYIQIFLNNDFYENIPSDISDGQNFTIKEWQMINNQIKKIEKFAFRGVQGLASLSLTNNFIADLDWLSIPDMKALEKLYLNNNSLTILNSKWFIYTTAMSLLEMSSNLLTVLDSNTFENLPKLKRLELAKNNIDTIRPHCFSGLEMLTYLNLNANKIKILESNAMAGLMSVNDPSVLLLSNQNIQEIQPFAFIGLHKIPTLTLASNSLKSLMNNSFYGMNKLTRLDLSNNNIDFIELDAFIGLIKLVSLDLSLNYLKSTPPWQVLSNIANLQSLKLDDNEINLIQRDSLQVVGDSLVNLHLANNKLQFIKNDYFSNLFRVEFLDLKSNSISTIESKSFIALRNLKQLFLSNNCVFKISPLLFQNQGFLSELLLDSNLLTNIELVFSKLSSLKTLNLAYNSIYQLSNQTFNGLNNLNSINLSSNIIKSLNESLIPLKLVRTIDLTNNKILIKQDKIHTVSNVNTYEYYFHNTSIELINYVIGNTRISKLDLSFNDLSKNGLIYNIPFQKMSAYLIHLDLRRTGLNDYAVDSLNVLKMLSYIDLSNNLIKFNRTFFLESPYLASIKLSNINMSHSDFETYIDLSLFRFLRVVDLSLNGLEVIKLNYFKKTANLIYLNLSHNKIKSIETLAFKANTALGFLDMTSNQLTSLLTIFFDNYSSTQSVKLLVANNEIQYSDLKLEARPDVPMVNLSGNKLKEIPSQISTFILDMSANLATSITKNTFIKMSELNKLYISSNLIETIEENSFLKLTRLTTLDLSNNRLQKLENDTFCGLFSVLYLTLSQNSLEVIQKSLFRQLVTLDQLFLSANPIKLIEDESFLNQYFLRTLNLDSYDPYNENGSLTMTNSTFAGLINVKKVILENKVLNSLTNVNNLFANLKPINSSQNYYKSIYVIYAQRNYTDWDCFLVLFSIRSQIQVNLYDDAALGSFLDYCGQYSLTQLQNIIESDRVEI